MGDDKDGDHHDDRPIEFAGNHCISIAPHRIESKPNSGCWAPMCLFLSLCVCACETSIYLLIVNGTAPVCNSALSLQSRSTLIVLPLNLNVICRAAMDLHSFSFSQLATSIRMQLTITEKNLEFDSMDPIRTCPNMSASTISYFFPLLPSSALFHSNNRPSNAYLLMAFETVVN